MRNEVSETYITHPCSRGFATWVAATRTQTKKPKTWKRRKGQRGASGGQLPIAEVSLVLCLARSSAKAGTVNGKWGRKPSPSELQSKLVFPESSGTANRGSRPLRPAMSSLTQC